MSSPEPLTDARATPPLPLGITTPLDLADDADGAAVQVVTAEPVVAESVEVDAGPVLPRLEPVVVDVDAGETATKDGAPRTADAGSPTPAHVAPVPVLVSTARQTFVYSRADLSSAQLGYLRSGAVVGRAQDPAGFGRCRGGFYAIEPFGFVCAGKSASLDGAHLAATAVDRRAQRTQPLPYVYAEAGPAPPQLFTRLPRGSEGASQRRLNAWQKFALRDGEPTFLQGGAPSLRSNGKPNSLLPLRLERAVSRSSFALVDLFQTEQGAWGLTPDLLLLPLNDVKPVEVSTFQGVELGEAGTTAATLPLVFVMERGAFLYEGHPGAGLRTPRRIAYREALSLSGESIRSGGNTWLGTRGGAWLLDSPRLVRVEARSTAPHWAKEGRSWLDVSIAKQTMVAYLGMQPVYATLVSTGKDGAGDPLTTHSTVQGQFLIHTKHVTDEMKSDEPGDTYHHREVPYVQFFKDGFALHAAYWHDAFGAPKSHGCINLSPADARWLFDWTLPRVPDGWHGGLSLLGGTLIDVHL